MNKIAAGAKKKVKLLKPKERFNANSLCCSGLLRTVWIKPVENKKGFKIKKFNF